jgi:ribokinase
MAGLVLNETEASHLLSEPIHDIPSARHAATKLLTMGPRFVIVTLGDQGCVLKTADTDAHFPAYPITSPLKVVDTSAAGDTFVGALAVALVEGKKLPDAARFANLAAALTCTKIGTQASHPHPNRRRHPPFKVTCYFVAKINPPCSTGTWSGTSDCIEPA